MLSLLALLPDWLDPEQLLSSGGYVLLFVIVFAESGLLVGFFLPGDSLLFTAGAIAAGVFKGSDVLSKVHFNIWVLFLGCFVAAVAGDQVGYLIGRKAGPRLFQREDSRLFKQSHVQKGTEFFEAHGGRAIVLARFVPIVRTFVPTIAGVSRMHYSQFVRFNVVGGFLWAIGITLLGYLFGRIDFVRDNIEVALVGLVLVSLLPIAVEYVRHRRRVTV